MSYNKTFIVVYVHMIHFCFTRLSLICLMFLDVYVDINNDGKAAT